MGKGLGMEREEREGMGERGEGLGAMGLFWRDGREGGWDCGDMR